MKVTELRKSIVKRGLELIPLVCLTNDRKRFNLALLQPEDLVRVSDKYIGPDNTALAAAKVSAFLQCNAPWADLLGTPEYYVPVSVIDQVAGGLRPKDGGVWILSLNGVPRAELLDLINRTDKKIHWYSEDLSKFDDQKLLNPTCYVLNIKDPDTGVSEICCALQFKRFSMIDQKNFFESNHVQTGEDCLLINNDGSSASLITIVCSDSLNFNPLNDLKDHNWSNNPYIVFHPQLNIDPRDQRIREYRGIWSGRSSGENKLIVTLNWSQQTEIPGKPKTDGKRLSFSSIYFRDEQRIKVKDKLIELNHSKGLYYAQIDKLRTNLNILNFDEIALRVECACPSRTELPKGADVEEMPKAISVFIWDIETGAWIEKTSIPSGFAPISPWCGIPISPKLPQNISELDQERLVLKCSGYPYKFNGDPTLLFSFVIQDSEITKRITFAQDDHVESRSFRSSAVARFKHLCAELEKGLNPLPICIDWIALPGVELGFFGGGCNVRSGDRSRLAMVVYIGDNLEVEAKRTYLDYQSCLDARYWNSLCVYYLDSGVKRFEHRINTDISNPQIDGSAAIMKA